MDLRIEAEDGHEWLELREAEPQGDDGFSSFVRVHVADRIYRRPFWFERRELQEFVREGTWLIQALNGEATLSHAGRPDHVSIAHAGDEWSLSGELFDFSDPEGHVRFRFPVGVAAARAFLEGLGGLLSQRSYAG